MLKLKGIFVIGLSFASGHSISYVSSVKLLETILRNNTYQIQLDVSLGSVVGPVLSSKLLRGQRLIIKNLGNLLSTSHLKG